MTTLFQLNPALGIPIHVQLIDQVKRALDSGALRPGDELPGVRPLAEDLVISPNTVAKAYRELEQEGVIDLGAGAGTALALTGKRAARFKTWADRRFGPKPGRAQDILGELARRDRELETAREVQQRLFPQDLPHIACLDYAGLCRPAQGVGGDYFDFIRLSDTELGIAIGDVSGKGMPAALLMATLRAYLRGQATRRLTDLTVVMAHLNRLVYESSSSNRYATLFYAQYDSSTRALEYVNAGHNPPLMFRTRGARQNVLSLDAGGPVIGLMPDCSYVQGGVTLEPNDLVVAFTDGITDAMTAAEEEWGEDRLSQIIASNRALPARELIDQIMRTADEFVGGASQYDDMTLIAARIK